MSTPIATLASLCRGLCLAALTAGQGVWGAGPDMTVQQPPPPLVGSPFLAINWDSGIYRSPVAGVPIWDVPVAYRALEGGAPPLTLMPVSNPGAPAPVPSLVRAALGGCRF